MVNTLQQLLCQIRPSNANIFYSQENSIEFWEGFVREFFNENAVYKHIVWVNNKREVRKFGKFIIFDRHGSASAFFTQ